MSQSDKAHIRQHMRMQRKALGAWAQEQAAAALVRLGASILDHPGVTACLDLSPGVRVKIAGYVPVQGEIDPRPLLHHLRSAGHLILLPVVRPDQNLEFRSWRLSDPLEMGRYDIQQPSDAADVHLPDLVLVPLLAFDLAGYRLGQGGGHYDRALAGLRRHKSICAIGIAHDFQRIATVPNEPHDQKLDLILTDQAIYRVS